MTFGKKIATKETGKRTFEVVKSKDSHNKFDVTLYAELNGKRHEFMQYGFGGDWGINEKYIQRLGAAWVAKAFCKKLTLAKCDPKAAGPRKTYVSNLGSDYPPSGRTMNADLKRLRF